MKTIFENFTKQYAVSKTLRFELISQGNFTMDDFIKSQSFEDDLKRAEAYPLVKQTIDGYHKWFIDDALKGLIIDWQPLKDAIAYYRKDKNESTKKALYAVQKAKRKEIYNVFNKHKQFQYLFKEDLISDLLPIWIEADKDADAENKKKAVHTFNRFSTYFAGFHKNRKNIYSEKAISTSVPYRITHDNFPKFLGNLEAFEIIKKECPSVLKDTAKELQSIMEGRQIEDIFSFEFFNHTLTQSGIDFYNRIIGGVTPEKGQKLRGINEVMNLYRQQHPEFAKNKKATKMVVLFKQILSDRETLSFIPERFANDKQVQESIVAFYTKKILQFEMEGRKVDVCDTLVSLSTKIKEFDLNKIYIQQAELTNISQKLFESWNELNTCLFKYAESKFGTVDKPANKKKIDSWLKLGEKTDNKSGEFSIAELNEAFKLSNKNICIEEYFSKMTIIDDEKSALPNKIVYKTIPIVDFVETYITNKYRNEIKAILEKEYNSDLHLREQADDVERLKAFLDAFQELMHQFKPLCISVETDRDTYFYNEFDELYNQLKMIVPLYNEVRNYVTQKLYSTDKIKLYFENKGQFLGGWVDSQTENSDNGTQAGGYLFRKKNAIKEYDYYLGICSDAKLFRRTNDIADNDKSQFERMDYYQLKTASVYGNSYQGIHPYTEDKDRLVSIIYRFIHKTGNELLIEEIAKDKAKENPATNTPSGFLNLIKKKNPNVYNNLLNDKEFELVNKEVVSALKATLQKLVRVPKALIYTQKDYKLFAEIINDIDELSLEKSFSYFPISQAELDEALNRRTKPLFFFKISNKDLSFAENFEKGKRKKIGKKNLHTLYFEALMNGNQSTIDIGTGMVFHREKSLNYTEEILKDGHHAEQLKDKFNYPIIKDKRFSSDKLLFHLSTEINYKEKKKPHNTKVLDELLNENPDVNIIGLDRGERNLIYLSLINQKGEILKQKSFNKIGGTDYQEKLVQREKERDKARKSWSTIGKIKELKEGYLSQLIHEIATMMVEHNAIVVLEDLNFGFKRGRFKVERQVYQKFEKMLIDKLNYLVFKEKALDEAGGILKGYQLAEKFISFKALGKQCGFLFYVPAAYTSKIDPTTGFVNLLNLNPTNKHDAQILFGNMDSILYNPKYNYFEFSLNYDKFTTSQTDWRKSWTICTVGEKRFAYVTNEKGQKETKTINVTRVMKELFDSKGIEYANGTDIKTVISQQREAKFYERLLWLFKLTMQMRNSNAATNEDFILSPVKNSKGVFFISNNEPNSTLPADADANGAYHIALKGLVLLKRLREKGIEAFEKSKKVDKNGKTQWLPHEEWLRFVQNKSFKE